MILAAKVAARELGPVVFVDGGEAWNTEKLTMDAEWIAFAQLAMRRSMPTTPQT
jgi:hypothetical protein